MIDWAWNNDILNGRGKRYNYTIREDAGVWSLFLSDLNTGENVPASEDTGENETLFWAGEAETVRDIADRIDTIGLPDTRLEYGSMAPS